VYRRILGPVYDNEKENLRLLTNKEMYARVKKRTVTETISLNKLQILNNVQQYVRNFPIFPNHGSFPRFSIFLVLTTDTSHVCQLCDHRGHNR